jgi:hypothetical protein
MGFVERYVRALGRSNLQFDARHRESEPLLAGALATHAASDLGVLLYRVKYVDDPMRSSDNLARLLQLWTAEVTRLGRANNWLPEQTAWDAQAARKLYCLVAELSLAHWLDDQGRAETPVQHPGGFVRERVKDMVSELHRIASSHAAHANARMDDRGR